MNDSQQPTSEIPIRIRNQYPGANPSPLPLTRDRLARAAQETHRALRKFQLEFELLPAEAYLFTREGCN